MFFGHPIGEELAAELVEGTKGAMSKVYMMCSGAEAVESAMKMARQYYMELSPKQHRRINFIAREGSYHGSTLGSLSLSGHVGRRKLFQDMLLKNIHRVSAANEYRGKADDQTTEQYVQQLAAELDHKFQEVGPDTTLGTVPAPAGYFKAMKEVCEKYGALLIMDEVMSGMGRVGSLHAWEQEDVVPDIETIAKGLGGGFAPVAAVLINHRVANALTDGSGTFSDGHTYQGHPVGCAAALEVQRIIKEDNLVDNVRENGKYLGQLLHEHLDGHPYVGNIRGRGFFWSLEFVADKGSKEPFPPSAGIASKVHTTALNDTAISLYPGTGTKDGVNGDHVLLAPAYTSTRKDVERIADKAETTPNRAFWDRNFTRSVQACCSNLCHHRQTASRFKMRLTHQLAAVAAFVLPAAATQWTVTSYYVATETTSVWTMYDETYTDLMTFGLQKTYTPDEDAATSTSSYIYTYDDLKVVEIYVDPAKIEEDQIVTSTSYEYSYDAPETYYVQNIVYTAPTSCPTAFTVTTRSTLAIPTEVLDGVSFESLSTSYSTDYYGDRYTYVDAVVPDSLIPTSSSDLADDYVYSYYIADCRNPTATGDAFYGPSYWGSDDDDDDSSSFTSGSSDDYDSIWGYQPLRTYVIVVASVIPSIFLLGFFENYFWFRRMMTGKFSLRFGTCCWIFLLLPVMCFTRQCPARDSETQKALKAQWKQTGFGKALGLWFKHGFRHRYPVDLLGVNPVYNNPAQPQQPPMGQPYPGGPPPPGGYIYYGPGPQPDGSMSSQGDAKGMPPHGMPPHGMPQPPPGMVMYYPQYPQQAYMQPQPAPAPGASPSSPSVVSDATQQAQYAPTQATAPSQDASAPQTVPQPQEQEQHFPSGQPGPSAPPATHQQ
ncbi:uncharacterized protein J7T54_000139 [Emericellopsis cladophorae]|uniref:Aminotransferase n=1 Tax=Emericellopsis cladophorae TaxID=2686198 RepID=A0A9Q0BDF7_9HYPO|nr:uncharacterized protein J7T54_000139 [Emericellopsis cladophorae]KAI6780500.1 hypothetical protein J7T54_000139 [Emericellopsis cladophorae]